MQNVLSFFGRIAGLAVLLGCAARTVHGAELPPVQTLQELMGTPAQAVRVYEPHLSVGDRHVAIRYVGYPAAAVFERILGKDWQSKGETVEFRALDESQTDSGIREIARALLVGAAVVRSPSYRQTAAEIRERGALDRLIPWL